MTVTLASTQDVIDRMGPYVNAAILASGAMISRYIEAAEGSIVSETRRDWITDYTNVVTEVKEELRICTACHAAMEIIQYDMSGYITRGEIITQLNVLDANYQRTLKALKDQDTIKIRSAID